jgi:hypothetical protein
MSKRVVKIEVLAERVHAVAKALRLQAKEYSRRLEELNHAHDKQVQDQATYVSSERYDGTIKEWTTWRMSVERQLSELTGRERGIGMSRANLIQIILIAIGLAGIVTGVWFR